MKRQLTKLLLFLLLGAIINIAVAWGIARFVIAQPPMGRGKWLDPIEWRAPGLNRRCDREQIEPLHWISNAPLDLRVEFLHEAGWPALAMSRREVTYSSSMFSLSPIPCDEYRLFDPIWPGFAINTIFYAAILWLMFVAPFAWRRRQRLKRGLCPKCAYDLRGLRGRGCDSQTCPECGPSKAGP